MKRAKKKILEVHISFSVESGQISQCYTNLEKKFATAVSAFHSLLSKKYLATSKSHPNIPETDMIISSLNSSIIQAVLILGEIMKKR